MTVAELEFGARTRGRAQSSITAVYVRDLTPADHGLLASERGIKPPALQKLRDRHHALARCLASGMKDSEASAVTGYEPSRISILKQDPSFQQLLADYRAVENHVHADFIQRAGNLSLAVVNEITDRLEESPEAFSVPTLLEVGKFAADRTGNAPVQKSVSLNVNAELGDRLSAARRRLAGAAALAPPTAPLVTEPGLLLEGELREVAGGAYDDS